MASRHLRLSDSPAVRQRRQIPKRNSPRYLLRNWRRQPYGGTLTVYRPLLLAPCPDNRHLSLRQLHLAGEKSYTQIWSHVRTQSEGPELAPGFTQWQHQFQHEWKPQFDGRSVCRCLTGKFSELQPAIGRPYWVFPFQRH